MHVSEILLYEYRDSFIVMGMRNAFATFHWTNDFLLSITIFQSSIFNSLSERKTCIISKFPSKLDGLM